MKISILSKADAAGGGASKVAVDLSAALKQSGADVTHYVGWAGTAVLRDTYPDHVEPLFGKWPGRIALKTALFAQWQIGIPEAVPVEFPWLASSPALDANIVHIHDITELMSPLTLLWLSRRKKVVWTLHDMSALTAGCIAPFDKQPMGCHRWHNDASGCGSDCPLRAIRGYPFGGKLNGVPLLWREKALLARYGRAHLVSPSRWLAEQFPQSRLYHGRTPAVIANGIDTNSTFQARPKPACKQALGIAPDRLVIALMAGHLSDTNKGFALAIESLQHLPDNLREKLHLVCIGKQDRETTAQLNGYSSTCTGYVQDQRLLAILLSGSDLMLYPSMADNQPLAVIESMACGTPVFAFATGGIPDIVGQEAGAIVPRGDTVALANAVTMAWRNGTLPRLSSAARERAERLFSRERMAGDYLQFYQETLAHRISAHPKPLNQ